MAAFLLVNPRAGDARPAPEELAEAAVARGIDVHVLRESEDPAELARGASADAIGIAGGDGSLAPVAAVARDRDLPFVCVPYGTRNHFARDLGLDRDDPVGALAAFRGRERRIDVARAGDRMFLNNVSLGLYAQLVHRREEHRRRRDALARVRALAILLRERKQFALTVDGRAIETPVALVANNAYLLELLSIGERERLDEGLLHLYALTGLVRSEWRERSGERFTIGGDGPVLAAAVDGEPAELETPIEFRIEPRTLRVLVPPGR
ncbi:MAG TPA: diacylglycerol kinase family protein [Gaiellaceae bacterium]